MSTASFPILSTAQLLICSKEKGLVRYNGTPVPLLHGLNRFAAGEGAPYAYGAMFALDKLGYNGDDVAEIAVAAAIDGSVHCNGQVVSLKL